MVDMVQVCCTSMCVLYTTKAPCSCVWRAADKRKNERRDGRALAVSRGIAQPNWVIIYSVNARARSMSLSKLCHSYVVHLRNEVFLPLHTLYWSEPQIKPETDPSAI